MSDALGDFLSGKNKELIVPDRLINQGSFFHCFVSVIKTPKNKFFLILNPCPDKKHVGVMLVNSEINVDVLRTPHLQSLQYKLKKSDYDFLTHDSFLNCSQIFELEHDYIHTELQNSLTVYKGTLNSYDTVAVFSLIKTAKTHSKNILKKYRVA